MDDETRAGFDRMDKYFGLIQQELERSNAGVLALDTRQESFEKALASLTVEMRERFNSVDERFNSVDERFNSVDRSFNSVDERFISADEQSRTLTLRIQHFEVRVEDALGVVARDVTSLKEQTAQLTNRMKNVEVGIGDLNSRVDTLADEIRQRFRFRGA
jgi:chromosome segregation ATPase